MGTFSSSLPPCRLGKSHVVRCEEHGQNTDDRPTLSSAPPPSLHVHETLNQRLMRNFLERPLLPVGCVATGYFLFSGIRSFQKRDPVASQKMMRNRVAAQFFTLACFVGYLGASAGADWRLAPHTQDSWKQQSGSSSSSSNSGEESQ